MSAIMRHASLIVLAASLLACGGEDPVDSDASFATDGTVCQNSAAYGNPVLDDALRDRPDATDSAGRAVIDNFTSWPIYDPSAGTARMDANVVRTIDDTDEARANLASRYPGCEDKVAKHLEKAKPNVYIYFSGFGGADQNNSQLDEGAWLRWVNDRDPSALIFAINWNCAASADPWCKENTAKLAVQTDDPEFQSMVRSLNVLAPDTAEQMTQTIGGMIKQQEGYDSALSHSMWLAARLIDQLLVADGGEGAIGDIRIAGYSMGAHAAAQILVQDFEGDGSGFNWSREQCEDGGNRCTVAGLEKVKWSLSMGLSGWSHALQTQNGFDAAGIPSRDAADREQYHNGGLLRATDPGYRGKLAVLNRRMDPTGNSDDTFERGFNDIFYGDYNHYSHDYSLPIFINSSFLRTLDAFLESDTSVSVPELGIITDNAGYIDFDDCPAEGTCEAGTNYLAHEVNRSHANLAIPLTSDVATVDGVPHADRANNRAASFTGDGARAIALNTFDQEDLRGGVELYFRPRFEMNDGALHGLFSYGSCAGSEDDLMPEAYFDNGQLVFAMSYQGQSYTVSVAADDAGIGSEAWSHLAFTWELPVESMVRPHQTEAELAAVAPEMAADLQKHQLALVLANGIRKPMPTTYKRQVGEGELRIYVNGELAAKAALGSQDSRRECLTAAEVVSTESYDVNGRSYPPHIPYARYDAQQGDIVAFSPQQVIGTKCKAYRVRNTQVFFGCAQSDGVNASGDMDDVLLVWGPGRTEYANVGADGSPVLWPIGAEYDAEPLVLR